MNTGITIDRNVVLDLLPLYLADEVSPETRTLVEEHLARDPDLARLAEGWKQRMSLPPPPPANPDDAAVAYQQARREITHRIITLAIVITVGFIALSGIALVGVMFLLRM